MQLTLPRALREAQNRQQLSSLALLGQEFWRYPMAGSKLSLNTSPTQTSLKTESSGIGTTIFSTTINNNQQPNTKNSITPNNATGTAAIFSPTVSNPMGLFSQAGTPSDTNSSLSSFTASTMGQQVSLLSPESIDSAGFALISSPIESSMTSAQCTPTSATGRIGVIGKTSTFKTQNLKSLETFDNRSIANTFLSGNNNNINDNTLGEEVSNGRTSRPTPPCTLNLAPLR